MTLYRKPATYAAERQILASLQRSLESVRGGLKILIYDRSTPDSIRLGLRAARRSIEVADMLLRGCLREYEMRGRAPNEDA